MWCALYTAICIAWKCISTFCIYEFNGVNIFMINTPDTGLFHHYKIGRTRKGLHAGRGSIDLSGYMNGRLGVCLCVCVGGIRKVTQRMTTWKSQIGNGGGYNNIKSTDKLSPRLHSI